MRRGLAALVYPTFAGQSPEFEVASIKRNTTNQFATGPLPNPATGLVSLINVTARTIVLRAYPVQTFPIQVVGLPSWAESERYDVVAQGKAGATPEEQQQMWRALLTDRMKLAAHYEPREQRSWDLVFARSDHRLGPQIKPSTLDCSQPYAPPCVSGTRDGQEADGDEPLFDLLCRSRLDVVQRRRHPVEPHHMDDASGRPNNRRSHRAGRLLQRRIQVPVHFRARASRRLQTTPQTCSRQSRNSSA